MLDYLEPIKPALDLDGGWGRWHNSQLPAVGTLLKRHIELAV